MPQKYKLVLTVFVSVLVHLLLFALLYSTKQTKTIILPESEQNPINARLYFYTPPAPVITEVEEEPPLKSSAPLPAPEETKPEQKPEVEEQERAEEPPQTEQVSDNVASLPPITTKETPPAAVSAVKNQYRQPLQDLVKDQLNGYQQGKLDKLAAQAAAEYRKQLTSPTLLPTPKESFLTEEEKYMQKVTTSVDCSSATNQTLAVVMGIMGGAVKCSEPPPFDSFIQKRLNKTAELPALQQ